MQNIEEKDCPECGLKNPKTNIFCPQCGFCFIEEKKEKEEPSSHERHLLNMEVEKNKRLIRVLVVVIIVMAVFAGVASFFISMEIQRSTLVTVETGTRWQCGECGEIYKNRVTTIDVSKSESEKYGVETVEGTCYACRYGEGVGRFADWLELLYYNGYFYGSSAEISEGAAEFISANPELFPAGGLEQVAGIAADADPRLVEKDYADYTGKLIHVSGRVTTSDTVRSESGAELTYITLTPLLERQELNVNFIVLYFGDSNILRGDAVDCYLLPVDLVRYKEGEVEKNAVVTIAAYITVK